MHIEQTDRTLQARLMTLLSVSQTHDDPELGLEAAQVHQLLTRATGNAFEQAMKRSDKIVFRALLLADSGIGQVFKNMTVTRLTDDGLHLRHDSHDSLAVSLDGLERVEALAASVIGRKISIVVEVSPPS